MKIEITNDGSGLIIDRLTLFCVIQIDLCVSSFSLMHMSPPMMLVSRRRYARRLRNGRDGKSDF